MNSVHINSTLTNLSCSLIYWPRKSEHTGRSIVLIYFLSFLFILEKKEHAEQKKREEEEETNQTNTRAQREHGQHIQKSRSETNNKERARMPPTKMFVNEKERERDQRQQTDKK